MGKFKVGDRVIYKGKCLSNLYQTGDKGKVEEIIDKSFYRVRLDNRSITFAFHETELGRLVKKKKQSKCPVIKKAEGIKHDKGKPPVSLIPTCAIMGMARVFGFGANKYGRHNFRLGMDHSRVLDAALRHILAITDGQDIDPESGEPHWAHALCCLSMYAYFKTANVGTDDRYKKEGSNE